MSDPIHDWFDAEGFRIQTTEYGECDLSVTGGDRVDTDAYIDGSYEGTQWDFPVEGECGGVFDGQTIAFHATLSQAKDADQPTLTLEPIGFPDRDAFVPDVVEPITESA